MKFLTFLKKGAPQMTHFKSLSSLSSIDDPLIYRSMHAFMAFCIYE
jgi:hypothetical protein